MTDEVRFGTDGWRARIGDTFTYDNLRRVAAAAATYYRDERDAATRGLVIGHDRRFAARDFARAAAEVVVAHGVPVWLTADATPTPVISFSVLDRGAAGAINITASHNPPADLGFKVRDDKGAALDPEALAKPSRLSDGAVYAQSKLALTMWSGHMALALKDNGPVMVAVNPASMLGSKMVKEAYGEDGGNLRIGADILCRAALSDEFSKASGLYFDNDTGRFAAPHPDARNPQKCANVVRVIEAVLSATAP